MVLTDQQALRAIEMIGSIGVFISSTEMLARPTKLADSSLMSWPVFRLRHRWFSTGVLGRLFGSALSYPRIIVFLAMRLAAAAALVLRPWNGLTHTLLLATVVVGTSALMLRTTFGLDGADQLVLIVFTALALQAAHPSTLNAQITLWFITLQVVLAYFTAGIYKVTSPVWLSGDALTGILNTKSYGHPRLAQWFGNHATANTWASRSLSASETAFPLVLIVPHSWIPLFLAWGIFFHATCAWIMGLNDFIWAFTATYPAIVYCAQH